MLGDRMEATRAEKAAQGAALDQVLDHFLMADELYRCEKFAEAIKEFDQVLESKPGHFWAQYLNAICLLRRGGPPRPGLCSAPVSLSAPILSGFICCGALLKKSCRPGRGGF